MPGIFLLDSLITCLSVNFQGYFHDAIVCEHISQKVKESTFYLYPWIIHGNVSVSLMMKLFEIHYANPGGFELYFLRGW